jgi:hypothetical protein
MHAHWLLDSHSAPPRKSLSFGAAAWGGAGRTPFRWLLGVFAPTCGNLAGEFQGGREGGREGPMMCCTINGHVYLLQRLCVGVITVVG